MDLRQLRYFLAVAEAKSFVNAANNLYISRQAISKAIGQLESELEVELFLRDSNGSALSAAGEFFYERVRTIILDIDGLQNEMQGYQSRNHHRIRLSFSIGAMQLFEPRLLDYIYTQELADIEYIECPESEVFSRLLERKADIAVSTSEIRDPLFVSHELLRSRYGILIQDHDSLAELPSVEIKDLSWLPLAGHNDSQMRDFCEKHRLGLRYPGHDYLRLMGLVSIGKCALLIPECLVPKTEGLRWIPIETQDSWILYTEYPHSLEGNPTYSTVIEALNRDVFQYVLREKQLLPI